MVVQNGNEFKNIYCNGNLIFPSSKLAQTIFIIIETIEREGIAWVKGSIETSLQINRIQLTYQIIDKGRVWTNEATIS